MKLKFKRDLGVNMETAWDYVVVNPRSIFTNEISDDEKIGPKERKLTISGHSDDYQLRLTNIEEDRPFLYCARGTLRGIGITACFRFLEQDSGEGTRFKFELTSDQDPTDFQKNFVKSRIEDVMDTIATALHSSERNK